MMCMKRPQVEKEDLVLLFKLSMSPLLQVCVCVCVCEVKADFLFLFCFCLWGRNQRVPQTVPDLYSLY